MRVVKSTITGLALLAGLTLLAPGQARGQVVGFSPEPGSIMDGVSLSVTPVVSADRRYVRLSLAPNFQVVNGFQTFPIPGAIAGGGNGGGHLGGGGGLGGAIGGGAAGGAGFRSITPGRADFAAWYPGLGVPPNDVMRRPEPLALKPLKAGVGRNRKPLPDPVIIPIKKKADPSKAAAPPR